ncbi:capsular polysaccharide biosynthesis protein [Psychrobacter sp. JCM 18900]|uniref:capsular polysaccharide biosynthesis protein n=1 Tax=Psychrobacter sp. JCM 18900 TaxID=1298608 RepID=UPI0004340283|nr:capsular polysaccharide biosynthesis protein [Psychrobacter sp. JCM 18900]GAF52041.1 capsular polysaccharide export system protein KpsC [Psychrobacter sp. JCM 18900]
MAKKVANEVKVSDVSTSDHALLSPSSQYQSPKQLAVVGKGMCRNNLLLSQVLQADIQRWYPWSGLQQSLINRKKKPQPEAFIGWGHKKSFQRADKAATRQDVNTLSIEDGFLRSLDSGISSRHGLSVVVDDVGIYFDMTHHSRLEQLIVERTKSTSSNCAAGEARARHLMAHICEEKLSKYNSIIDCPSLDKLINEENINEKENASQSHILLIDQVAGDASVKGAGANKRQFKKMLKSACRNHPNAHIWIKAHPASKSGYLSNLKLPKNVRLLTEFLNPIELLKQVSEVYTVSSHMGFEALMLGKRVHCFGVSWYCGWGLTDDTNAPRNLLKSVQKRRLALAETLLNNRDSSNLAVFLLTSHKTLKTTLETLFYSAYIDYSRYVDPATKQACDIDTAIEWLVTNRRWQARLEGDLTIYEFSRWKLPFVKAFTDLPRTTLFVKPKPRLKNLLHPDHFRVNFSQPLLVWGLAKRQQVQKKLQSKLAEKSSDIAIYCMEDGFIRSNGLGATLLAPLSVVIDKQGIYYDATQPSDLETLLQNFQPLSSEQRLRVERLQDKLLNQRVSKYNVGAGIDVSSIQNNSWMQDAKISGRRRVLIIGQVEDDLSVQYCGSTIKTNSGLIERVRQDNPDAYLIYKPHPDVEAGLRAGKVSEAHLRQVQAVAYDTAMPDCLEWVDEVHTISSLTGFEALLRGLDVTCYGLPFYAGWGLTTDIDEQSLPKATYLKRRQRDIPLTLEQLIYGALICYPLYRLPDGYGLAQVEQVIDYLYPLKDSHLLASNEESQSKMANTLNSSANNVTSSLSTKFKRHATTRFMQQRHQWQQKLRKTSR